METEKSLLKEFVNGGWIVPLIGAGAMLARLLSSDSNLTVLNQIKRIITAALSSGVAWFVLEQTDISSLYKAITYGIIGVISPEVITGIVNVGMKFAADPFKFLKK
jgi:3-dehydroquinate synthase class II